MARKYTRDNRGRFASVGATARGGRLKTAGGGKRQTQTMRASARPGGTVGRPKGYKPGAKKKTSAPAKSATARQQSLTPSQLAGQRRRNSERPEARLERAQQRSSRRLSELQSKKSSLETALRRRRGKLDEASKKVAARELAKTNRRIQRVKDAEALYRQDIGIAKAGRALKMNYRTGKKAPDTEATRRNRLGVLRRRVSFLKKDEDKPRDVWGGEYDGPKLTDARKALTTQATTGMRGLRVTFRTKKQAAGAQRTRTKALIKQANTTKRYRDGMARSQPLYTKTVRLPITRQGNLLTGSADRVRGRRFLPPKRRR